MTLSHFKPKHHALVTELGFNQNNSGFYSSRMLSNDARSDLESSLKTKGFTGKRNDLNHSVTSYSHPEYPDLTVHIRKIDKVFNHAYITSNNHEPSTVNPVQRNLL